MHQKYSTTLFSQVNDSVALAATKTKFQLGFLTLLVGIVGGSHTAIAEIERQPQLIAGKPITTVTSTTPKKAIECPGANCVDKYKSRSMSTPTWVPGDKDKKVIAPNVINDKVIAPNVVNDKILAPTIFKAPSSR